MEGFNGMLLRGKYVNKKALSLAVCLAVSYSSPSYALGLGEIESSSHLNQPFRAKINLLSTSIADVKRLQVKVASPEVFRRVGIDRPAYLNSVSFSPTVREGKPVILVSSNKPITQPFLNFLIEVSWPDGQLLKEYTVLLDPPVLVQAGTAVANNTVGVRAEPKRQQVTPIVAVKAQQKDVATPPAKQIIAERKVTSSEPSKITTQKRNRTSKYRVVRGDTLSKIAKKLRYKGVRKEQMMMALFRANPTAFRKRNINNLKAGALLRRPSVGDVRQLSYKQAKSAIYKQSKQWRSKLAKSTVPQSQVKLSSSPVPKVQAVKNTQARIEVIGNSPSAVDTKNLSATGSAKISQLEQRLIQAKESLATKANANVELKSRVSELESLLRKKNRLITLKNEQLAELQAKLGVQTGLTNPSSRVGADISQQVKNSANAGDGTIVRSGDAANEENQKANVTPDPVINNSEQVALVNKVDRPSIFEQASENNKPNTNDSTVINSAESAESKQEPNAGDNNGSVLDLLSSPLVMGLGGGSLLLLLAGWLFMRLKGNAGDNEDYSSIDFDDPDFAPGSVSKDEKNTQANKNITDNAFEGLDGDWDNDNSTEIDKRGKKNISSIPDTSDDILQEADVYIVYGLHDQAEVELRKAIEKQPDNLQYHAKLLENYHKSSNLDAFDQQADIFSKLSDDKEGNKADLWKEIEAWAQDLESKSSLFPQLSSKGKGVAAAGVAAVAGGVVAITAGKAFAEDKQDDSNDLFAGIDVKPKQAINTNLDDINSKTTSELDDLDFTDLNLDNDHTANLNADGLDLEEFLSDTGHDSFNSSTADSLDNTSLDDLLADVESMPDPSTTSDSLVEEQTTELGAEFEDLLDLDLTDLSDDLSINPNKHDMSNLNLELNNNHDLNKILPTGSPYTSVKDDAKDSDSLLGDLDDDLSFMDLGGSDDDLKETQVSTKLDLARAYLDMGDMEGARNTLEEVMMEGNDDQKKEAEELLHQTG
jgi:pilus assembly protein FimV